MRNWRLRNEPWPIPARGGIMGILNVTPDSFSDGGLYCGLQDAVDHALSMAREGADIIDIGGESTRPGSHGVELQEECERTIPVIRTLRRACPGLRLSIDTRHAPVAEAALEAGADIVNDVSGLADPAMRALCATCPCGIVLMHMQGEPATMQDAPQYKDVVQEVRGFFAERVRLAERSGIGRDRICLDPGIGFGKTTAHNLALIARLEETRVYGLPLLMALSRKRFLGELFQDAGAARSSPFPTVVMSLLASERGADLHRVHDVRELHRALASREK